MYVIPSKKPFHLPVLWAGPNPVSSRAHPWLQVRQLQPQAVASWWQPGHPGWAIYPVDSDQFMSTGALDSLNVQNEQPSHTPSPGAPRIFPTFCPSLIRPPRSFC